MNVCHPQWHIKSHSVHPFPGYDYSLCMARGPLTNSVKLGQGLAWVEGLPLVHSHSCCTWLEHLVAADVALQDVLIMVPAGSMLGQGMACSNGPQAMSGKQLSCKAARQTGYAGNSTSFYDQH